MQALNTDFYEFTMAQAAFNAEMSNQICTFDCFFRKIPDQGGYVLTNGLEEVIEYIKNLKFTESEIEYLRSLNKFSEEFLQELQNLKFTGNITAIPDGTVVFPGEPLLTVQARFVEAALIETRLLQIKNFANLITTKSSRINQAAAGRGVMEFGARRAQEQDAAFYGAKYAYEAGCVATSYTKAGYEFGINVSGTMAHSWVQMFDNDYEAFLTYAKTYLDDCTFLVDTYNTLKSGVPNAIRVAKEYLIPNGYRLKAIRLDSGDLAYDSKEARKMLDEAGLEDCKICASNSLDEFIITDLLEQGAPIDSFGVGERQITAKSDPVFGGVYKLVELVGVPKIKVSNTIEKITTPGHKKTVRFYDADSGYALGDINYLIDEEIPTESFTTFDEVETWKQKIFANYRSRLLQVEIFRNGELVYKIPTVEEVKAKIREELGTLYEEIKRLRNPHKYIVNLSERLYNLKRGLLEQASEQIRRLEKDDYQ